MYVNFPPDCLRTVGPFPPDCLRTVGPFPPDCLRTVGPFPPDILRTVGPFPPDCLCTVGPFPPEAPLAGSLFDRRDSTDLDAVLSKDMGLEGVDATSAESELHLSSEVDAVTVTSTGNNCHGCLFANAAALIFSGKATLPVSRHAPGVLHSFVGNVYRNKISF